VTVRVASDQSDQEWVVRGGLVTVEQLANGTSPIADEPGFCQISVAYQPGRSVEELAALSRFPHRHIGVTTRAALLTAGAVEARRTPGRNPAHGDIIVACDENERISAALLDALAAVFEQRENPSRGYR
jgi:hypothetical protein